MTKNPVSLDKWRDYFSGADSDIFGVIEHAILVAASDFPHDFKVKRDRIAQRLFTCRATKCLGCLKKIDGDGVEVSKEMKMNSNAKTRFLDQECDEAELLSDQIDEESQFLEDIFRIKEVVDDSEGKSDEVLLESLKQLQLKPMTLEILKETQIGKSVNALRKHKSKDIRDLSKRLVMEWKRIVDEWAISRTPAADFTPESAKLSTLEEEGLPSPPLDEGAFLATPPMELSKFFEDIDEDGNLRTCGEFNKNRQNGTTRNNIHEKKLESSPNDSRMPPKEFNRRNQDSTSKKQSPPSALNAAKPQQNGAIQKKPLPQHQEAWSPDNESPDMITKLENSKRKLHDRYQEAENAKKMRTIKVVELRDLPKQCRNQITKPCRNQINKPGNRQWAQGRR